MKTVKRYASRGWNLTTAVLFVALCVWALRNGFGRDSFTGGMGAWAALQSLLGIFWDVVFGLGLCSLLALPGAAVGALVGWAVLRDPSPAPPATEEMVWPPAPLPSTAKPPHPTDPPPDRTA